MAGNDGDLSSHCETERVLWRRLPAVFGCCCYRFTLKASPGRGQILPGAGESFPQGVKASAETANIPYDTYEFWRFTDKIGRKVRMNW